MINVVINQASAAMQAPFGIFQTSPEARKIMESLMKEVILVARAMDVNLTDQDIDAWYTFLRTLPPEGKTSMLQDIEAGRKTEVEIFGEKVVELGRTHKIATPVNQTVSQIIRVLEQGTGSKF